MQPVEDTLKNLTNDAEPVSVAGLYALSDIDRLDVDRVRSVWAAMPADRRRTTMRHLVEITEDNFEVDFGAIYRLGLNDQDPGVRTAAIEGLWEDDNAALIPLLLKLLADPVETVRAAAAAALGRFVYAGELEDVPAGKVAPVRWTPEQIAKDPEGYLTYADAQIRDCIADRQAKHQALGKRPGRVGQVRLAFVVGGHLPVPLDRGLGLDAPDLPQVEHPERHLARAVP
jgi:hypothetical protein